MTARLAARPVPTAGERALAWWPDFRAERMLQQGRDPLAEQARRRDRALAEMVAHAYTQTSFHRARMDAVGVRPEDIRGASDLAALLPTTKHELREGFPARHLAASHARGWLRWSNTSGTTGRPLMLAQDAEDISRKYASVLWSRKMAGVDPFGVQVRITPNECQPCLPDGASPKGPLPWGRAWRQRAFVLLEKRVLHPWVHRRHTLPPGDLGPALLAALDALAPDILHLYPLYALALAKALRRSGRPPPRVGHLLDHTGALFPPRVRALVEAAFGQRSSQACGGCEFARYAASCPQDPDRMHLAEDHCYVETLGPDGRPCAPGELGIVLATSLHSRAMPILRLEPGDVARIVETPCACGQHSRRLQHEGRVQALLRNADDRWVSAREVWDALLPLPGLERFQLRQQGPRDYLVDLVPEPGRSPSPADLDEAFGRLLGGGARVRTRNVSEIAAEASGKLMLVKSSTFQDFRPRILQGPSPPVN